MRLKKRIENDLMVTISEGVLFKNIKKLEILKKFFGIFHELTGLSMDIMDKYGKCYQLYYNPPVFCETIQTNKKAVESCVNYDREHGLLLKQKREPLIFPCHAGVTTVGVPIIINNEFIGGFTIGSILLNNPSEKEFQNIYSKVKHLNINKSKLRKAYFNTLVISEEKLRVYIDFLQIIVTYIIEIEDKVYFLENASESTVEKQAKMFMKENYNKPFTLKEIANSVFLSPSYFERRFKKETGLTPLQYVTNLRISKAKTLLTRNNKILKVCYDIGYKSLSYFNKLFKKSTGFRPKEYQNSKIKSFRAR